MHQKHLLLLTFLPISLFAQKKEEGFDATWKPTKDYPRYYAITEPKAGKWYREVYYLPEKTMAMQGWYKDENCKIPDSTVTWYHLNRKMKSTGNYSNGKKEGIWISYHENGMMSDSGIYTNGHKKGSGLGWNSDGYTVDSSFYDGNGSGIEVTWYPNGPVHSTGRMVNDTSRIGRWNYYDKNGQKMAIEEYTDGKRTSVTCFSETGEPLGECEEKEAYFPGELVAWRQFLERNLSADVPVRNRAPIGKYTVVVQFIVSTDGSIKEITPLTHFGFGMEEEVVRIMKKCPRWVPAVQFGRKLNAYRKQPVTFVVGSR